jgi:N-dimethylarginine dimethylaminohydrolase
VRVGRQLEAWGFDVVTCDVSEFLKAGGGCRCLTLALDVGLGPGPAAAG